MISIKQGLKNLAFQKTLMLSGAIGLVIALARILRLSSSLISGNIPSEAEALTSLHYIGSGKNCGPCLDLPVHVDLPIGCCSNIYVGHITFI